MYRPCLRAALRSVITAVLLGCLTLGCGSSDGTYRVSGNVTFNGKPVPAGKVFFMPDTTKGNSGPTGFADIRNGSYDTSAAGGRGAPAGAVIITVEGFDPSVAPAKADPDVTATVLFPTYETTAEIPKSSFTKDIDVPASAAKGPAAPKSRIIIP